MSTIGAWTKRKIVPLTKVELIKYPSLDTSKPWYARQPADSYRTIFSLLEDGSQMGIDPLTEGSMGSSEPYGFATQLTLYPIPNNLEDLQDELRKIMESPPDEIRVVCQAHAEQGAGGTFAFIFAKGSAKGPPFSASVGTFAVTWGTETVPFGFRLKVNIGMFHSLDILQVTGASRFFQQLNGWS